ncbi:MAG: terpene cyclase/mutase family protein [Planctomycetes bacterium]|nr:terpene cyclase/mutase family protein [Planctomycetota bacterium]
MHPYRILAVVSLTLASFTNSSAGQELSLRPDLIDEKTEKSIERGLAYLARTQDRQGTWRNAGTYGSYPVAMSSLAALAMLMSGSTMTEGPHAENINRAANYILSSARTNGLIASVLEESRSMYGHGFSMLFLGQLYGMESNLELREKIARVLRNGVSLTARSQSRDGGWIYTPDSNSDEGSVTITQVQALRSCRNAGIAVPKKVIDNAMAYLDLSMRPDGGIAYRARQFGNSRPPITAAAVVCWYNAGQYDHPNAAKALAYCKANIGIGADRSGVAGHYYYAHLYYAQALYLAGAQEWKGYFPKMRDYLLSQQNDDGSWDGDSVGPVYGTAVALIILQLPYNNLPIMQR